MYFHIEDAYKLGEIEFRFTKRRPRYATRKEEYTMEITIFAKKREAKDGRKFTSYLATLTKKSGEKQTVAVKFREDCGAPDAKNCPMNIVADKKNLNMSERNYVDAETGEVRTSYTLWVSEWKQGTPYVDHSMDDYC